MKAFNVPALGPRYWVVLVMASAFGAETGDFAAHNLHLGHVLGLVPLAIVFGAILFAERRARVSTEAFYWFAIVTMRTAAVNLVVLVALRRASGFGVKAMYRVTMVAVRTAGTNVGDWLASPDGLGLGPPLSTTLTGLAFGTLVALWRPRPAPMVMRAV